ncbi:MAG: hypothetical protein ACLQJR_15025 [Stellaceae bacterium]
MRAWLLAIPPAMMLVQGACAEGVQLALDGAADLSPVYPTVTIPANEHDFAVIFSCGDQKHHQIATKFTPIDATGPYRINPQPPADAVGAVGVGEGTRFLMRQPFLTDLPVGRWTMTAEIDDQAVGSVEFKVVPPLPPLKLSGAFELAGSLAKGTEWNYEFRFLQQPRPGLKLTLDGIKDADAQGWIRTTLLHRIVSHDPEGARRDELRGSNPASSSWLAPTDRGLAVVKLGSGGDVDPVEPPQLIALLPNEQFHRAWQWHAKGDSPEQAEKFQMWGPLPVKTPQGEHPGYIVLRQIPDADDPSKIGSSVEYDIAPGLGAVHQVIVQSIPGANAATRVELDLTAMTRGSGPEPDLRKYPEGSAP